MQQRAKSFFLCGKSGKKKYRIRTEQERNEIQMKAQLEAIEKKAFEELTAAQDLKDLDAVRVKYLGKKGELTAILKQMGKLSAEERPVIGQLANQVRAQIEERLEETKTNLEAHLLDQRLATETLDAVSYTHLDVYKRQAMAL